MLQKNLGFAQGLGLYLAAVLGTGILIIPPLAWQEGGAASLIAWVVLGFLGLALAWTFATVGAEVPNAGGIQAMIGRVFGPTMGSLTRYLIYFSVPAGAVPASYIFAHHLCAGFSIADSFVPYFAFGSWFLVTAANYFGIRVSAGAQLVLSGALVILLSIFVAAALPLVRAENFFPFAPGGLGGIGGAALLIFWSFLGWEAIAHLAEEFRDPKRDMVRAAIVAAVVVGVFYFAVSFVLIGVGVFYGNAGQEAPLVEMAQEMFGKKGRILTGVLAAVICLGTMNVYLAGLSRLGYAMSRDGDLPAFLARLDPSSGTPRNSILCQLFQNVMALTIQFVFDLPVQVFLLIPNVAFLLLYFFGCLSTARLLRDQRTAMFAAYVSAAICAAMLPFAKSLLLYPAMVAVIALCNLFSRRRNNDARSRV